jgi:hypothetical protein
MVKMKIQTEVDFEAGLQPTTAPAPPDEPDFRAAMMPKKRNRPFKLKPPPAPQVLPINNISIYDSNNNYMDDISIIDKDINNLNNENIKDKLSKQESRFLEIYFNSPRLKGQARVTIEKAMISAGYTGLSQSGLYYVAGKICKKYERQAGQTAKIFQDLGFGPVRVALGVIDHCKNGPPTVSLNALKLAAQCQGMVEQPENLNAGITIIINTAPSPQPCGPGSSAPAVVVGISQPASRPGSPCRSPGKRGNL